MFPLVNMTFKYFLFNKFPHCRIIKSSCVTTKFQEYLACLHVLKQLNIAMHNFSVWLRTIHRKLIGFEAILEYLLHL